MQHYERCYWLLTAMPYLVVKTQNSALCTVYKEL